MVEDSRSDQPENKVPETKLKLSIYVPEDQLLERIPLCKYLSDLDALFENEDHTDANTTGIADDKEQP